jgi:uncharacterized lipoprotein YmbA
MKASPFLTWIVSALASFVLMTGCVSMERSYPEKRYFALKATDDRGSPQPINGVVLRIRRLRISPRYEGKSFVYRISELNYESDFYNEFLVSPVSLFTEEVRQGLANSGLFQHVVDPGSQLDYTHTLEGTVSQLYGDYRDPGSPKAALEMEFLLVGAASTHPAIVFQKNYRREVATKNRSPEALVTGWSEDLKQIMADLQGDLARVDFGISQSATK